MQSRRRFVGAAVLLAGLMLLAGCGQKGPLYLPEEEATSEDRAPAAQNQDAQDTD